MLFTRSITVSNLLLRSNSDGLIHRRQPPRPWSATARGAPVTDSRLSHRLRQSRPFVSPNSGFCRQLELYYRLGCRTSLRDPRFRRYRLRVAAQAAATGEFGGRIIQLPTCPMSSVLRGMTLAPEHIDWDRLRTRAESGFKSQLESDWPVMRAGNSSESTESAQLFPL